MREAFFPYKRVPSDIFGEVSIPVAQISLQGREEIGIDIIVVSGSTTANPRVSSVYRRASPVKQG